MSDNPLTPKPGYEVTITQLVGSPPVARVSCRLCSYSEPIQITAVMSDGEIGRVITAGITVWSGHQCTNAATPRGAYSLYSKERET